MSRPTPFSDLDRILIAGMGRSGVAAARAARRMLPGAEVILCDSRADVPAGDELARLMAAGVRVEPGRQDEALLQGCGLVVKSPGIPSGIPLFEEARRRGIPVLGELEFAWRFLPENILVGVTGTNGKTTTTELIGHLLSGAGFECRVAGNVGTALSSLVGEVGEDVVLVVELSSFQLEDSERLRPDIAVLLNLTEDHLDRHGDAVSYFSAKRRIFENQQPDDVAVVNLDDPECRGPLPGEAQGVWFSRGGANEPVGKAGGALPQPLVFAGEGVIYARLLDIADAAAGIRGRIGAGSGRNGPEGGEITQESGGAAPEPVFEWARGALKGEHNLENSLAATAVALCLGARPRDVAAGLESFPGVRHRLQEVRVVDGVTYVNDSKATNVDAAIKALTAYESGIHLILGGSLKGCSFGPLAEAASGEKVKEAILIGEAAGQIKEAFTAAGRDTVMAGDLENAVRLAWEHAAPGDVVLLSPACASFDQYGNYEQRGEHFISLVNKI